MPHWVVGTCLIPMFCPSEETAFQTSITTAENSILFPRLPKELPTLPPTHTHARSLTHTHTCENHRQVQRDGLKPEWKKVAVEAAVRGALPPGDEPATPMGRDGRRSAVAGAKPRGRIGYARKAPWNSAGA